jgi:hypothetical protein
MKYCFLILAFFAAAVTANAQTDKVNKALQDIYAKAGIEVKHTPLSNGGASLAKAAEETYVPEVILAYTDTDTGLTITRDSIITDDAGSWGVSFKQVKNGGSGWINVQKDSAVYLDGLEIIYDHALWENNTWTVKQRTYKEYNENGSLARLISDNFTQNDTTRSQITYVYDDNNRLSVATYSSVEDGTIVSQFRYNFTYNAAGGVTETLMEFSADGGWVNHSLDLVEYNEAGFETMDTYHLWEGNNWTIYERNVFTVDVNGLVSEQITQTRMSGVLEYTDSLSFTYYENRTSESEVSAYWDEGAWVVMDSIHYVHGMTGISKIEWYFYTGEEWLKWSKKTYTYDERGRLVILLGEEGTAENAWANHDQLLYEYDNAGNPVKGEYFEWDGSAWMKANGVIDMDFDYYVGYLVEAKYKLGPVAVEDDNLNPDKFVLGQNYPNPFNPETKISFSLPASGKASLKIYDMLGREVAELINGAMEKGTHTVNFIGRNLSSGVYIYRLQSGSFTESKKMMLLK